ncbi:flagellar export chaperone FliS [Thiomicrorhabdus arctica]|uniref:flagellar export chaperone FliS n=1 Tax=Thiomicrorhabdus arctica TaxID=131540 RepID=UPI00037C5E0C|nr:flagellar export chaperone FliS [Thiomicrorhabdus arctica]
MNLALKKQFIKQYANNYIETAVSEATPHKLVEMLYDGAIKNMNLAKVFIEHKNLGKKSEHINKALSIINALRAGVDMDKGAEVAGNLYDLYDYCYRRLFEASVKNDITLLDEVLEHIISISQAWKQMPDNIKRVSKAQVDQMSV